MEVAGSQPIERATASASVSRAQHRRILIQHDIDSNFGELTAQLLLIAEHAHKAPLLELGQNFQRDSAGDVNSAKGRMRSAIFPASAP